MVREASRISRHLKGVKGKPHKYLGTGNSKCGEPGLSGCHAYQVPRICVTRSGRDRGTVTEGEGREVRGREGCRACRACRP